MSLMNIFKEAFIRPMKVRVDTRKIGTIDTWEILNNVLSSEALVVAAGVGHCITFEEDLARTYGCKVILLDPSPTGQETMCGHDRAGGLIQYREVGLAAKSGVLYFGTPSNPKEGSFRKGDSADGIQFPCVSLRELTNDGKLDLLKIDIEGFEYEVLDSILRSKRPAVDQICVEIHTNRQIGIPQTILSAMSIILRLYIAGYRIIYNRNLDFTFAHTRLIKQPTK
jgi:FkbM family methyltransferase